MGIDEQKDDEITRILKRNILESEELKELIRSEAETIVREKEFPEYFTREQLSKSWQVSKKTVDRMTDEELRKEGFLRKKIGVSVRFERISSRELYNRIKGK